MKELNQFELENVSGGNDFTYDVGHAVGDGARWVYNQVGDSFRWVGNQVKKRLNWFGF
ncbi:bacteriocin [Neisseria chenwenguii]|uniref:bacteriocin n=1 Tax=Neisseria chenwenguii TaxID=1853278 RepID=UPI0012FDB4A2|nr:bacteriocin [Neisseria chenwenguii]